MPGTTKSHRIARAISGRAKNTKPTGSKMSNIHNAIKGMLKMSKGKGIFGGTPSKKTPDECD